MSFQVGDVVCRNEEDEHIITGINWDGMMINVKCIKGDYCFDVGDVESNLASRYVIVRKKGI